VTLSALLAKRANAVRRLYLQELERIVESPLNANRECDLNVYTFSGTKHIPEQVASLRSLIRHLGVPRRVVIVSDGTHSPEAARLIGRVHPRATVVDYRDIIRADLPRVVRGYAAANPMGAKLAMELSIDIDGPTIYADADVLYFPRIAEIADLARDPERKPRFLQDFDTRFLDARLLSDDGERKPPTNAGFQLLFAPLSWELALERFEAVVDPRSPGDGAQPNWHAEQTLVHLAMRASGATPLPPERYVLQVDDEYDWRDRYADSNIALRHYCFTDAVQRKLWLHVWDDLAAAARSSPSSALKATFDAALKWREDRSTRS
jgi:hypothetical protein